MINQRIALGTAQFGMPYGIANASGQVTPEEVGRILRKAKECGISTLDTAVVYGESEKVLGAAGVEDFNVISKLPPLPKEDINVAAWVDGHVEQSLDRLRLSRLDGLLLHRPEDLQGRQGVVLSNVLRSLKEDGRVGKMGISIYEIAEVEPAMQVMEIDMVQAPFNLVGRQLSDSGLLDRLALDGIEVHVRSVFLQGLLLLPIHQLCEKFPVWEDLWAVWDDWLKKTATTPAQACLNFVRSFKSIHRIVLGVDSLSQLNELLAYQDPQETISFPNIACADADLVNPARWSCR